MVLLLTENRGGLEHFLEMDEQTFLAWWEDWQDIMRARHKN